MPLLFTRICDLLSPLEDLSKRDPPLLPARLRHKTNEVVRAWFASHQVSIHSQEIDAVALLSALFPAKRTDRVYFIQAPRLGRCLRRWLNLGSGRWPLLDQWQQSGRGDLGDCVERVLQQAEHPEPLSKDKVTLEEIDNALENVASRCRFSAPAVRAKGIDNDTEVSNSLENIYKRLHSRDAKWFTRLILKDFSYLNLPDNLIFSCIDSRLPVALQIYYDFKSAVCELRNLPASQMVDTTHGGFTKHCANDIHLLHPRIGVKVGPPKWLKAKGGIKHAVSVIDGRTMSVERKYDGEYCQIHIDLSKGEDCIQIFSKSGKDSTEDRRGVYKAIKDSLRIGFDDCKFSEKCILEGELLVYSDRAKDILGFHKIRKHVSRSGSCLGTALDSQPHHWEHLMIVFCDILLVDDEPTLHDPYEIRRQRLKKLVTSLEGRANLSQRLRIDFSQPRGVDGLKHALASALAQRWEGLVLKPVDESYFDLRKSGTSRLSSQWIKLKKDCIKGLGDTADFAVVGAGYDAMRAMKYNDIPNLQWTHFYIGCLRNKSAVIHNGAKPQFLIFDEISDCIKKEDLKTLNNLGYFRSVEPNSAEASDLFSLEYAMGLPYMKTVFRSPFVFDVAGSGFDKSPNRDIFTLRFPRLMRIHWDRDWKESVSLDELQEIAAKAVRVPSEEIRLGEKALWVERLDELDKMPKGKLNSWDYSDDEEDDIEFIPSEGPIAVTSMPSHRSRISAVPPLVRMDTSEMKERERRLGTGEVVERPTPQDSMASTTTAGSLRTPPLSSPLSKTDTGVRGQQSSLRAVGHSREKTSKQSAAIADLQETPRQPKKSRSKSEQQRIGSSIDLPNFPQAAPKKRPLQEITNSAQGVHAPSPRSIPRAKEAAPKDPFLVRKLPAWADEDIHHRYQKKRRIEVVSSYSQETTASERSTTTTSQRTDPPEPEHATLQAPLMLTSNPQSLKTPPSTAEQALNIKLPELKECKIVLSPCLIKNHEPIAPLKAILDELSISPSSFRLTLQSPKSNNILHDTLEATTQIILLVDPDSKATVDYISALIRNVPKWHPIPLAVWDWQVLHILTEEDPAVETDDDVSLVRSLFFARLGWIAEWEGKGAVKIKWRDGLVTMLPEGRLEDFGMGMRRG